MAGKHRKPREPLRAPLSEWMRDAFTVITHTLYGVPLPDTTRAQASVAEPEQPDEAPR